MSGGQRFIHFVPGLISDKVVRKLEGRPAIRRHRHFGAADFVAVPTGVLHSGRWSRRSGNRRRERGQRHRRGQASRTLKDVAPFHFHEILPVSVSLTARPAPRLNPSITPSVWNYSAEGKGDYGSLSCAGHRLH